MQRVRHRSQLCFNLQLLSILISSCFQSFELYKYQITDVVRSDSTTQLERNFRRFLRLYAQKEFDKLPRDIRYYPLIEECYNRIFYGRAKRPESCPGKIGFLIGEVERKVC